MMFVDPDGKDVHPAGQRELDIIRSTLPEEARKYVQLNENGFLDRDILNTYSGKSTNFANLKSLVNDNIIIDFTLSDHFTFMDKEGALGVGLLSYFPPDPFLKDTGIEYVSGLTTGESGNYGKTLFPDRGGEQNSPNSNIIIILHPSLSIIGAAESFSHEGYGHALLYIRNGGDHQGASHQTKGMQDLNIDLVNLILSARRETINNLKK